MVDTWYHIAVVFYNYAYYNYSYCITFVNGLPIGMTWVNKGTTPIVHNTAYSFLAKVGLENGEFELACP